MHFTYADHLPSILQKGLDPERGGSGGLCRALRPDLISSSRGHIHFFLGNEEEKLGVNTSFGAAFFGDNELVQLRMEIPECFIHVEDRKLTGIGARKSNQMIPPEFITHVAAKLPGDASFSCPMFSPEFLTAS